ncbi:MAG: peptide-methionine (S)-S-oxide reductase MsrA [Coriobacteriia bacterium]
MLDTRVGYAGGTTPHPTYRSMGDHSESIQIDFDPAVISYEDLLAEFWASHRPTRPSRSRQYASLVLYADEEQRQTAEASKRAMESRFGTMHTDILPLGRFHLAEEYHQKYYAKHGMLGAACPTAR